MRAIVLVAVVSACNGDSLPTGNDMPGGIDLATSPDLITDQASIADAPDTTGCGVCNISCPTFATCVVADDTLPVCASPCKTDDDCMSPMRCLSVILDTADFPQKGPPYQMSPRVCLASNSLPVCPGRSDPLCSGGTPIACADGTTLEQTAAIDGTCGIEFVRCPNQCIPDHHCG